MQTLNAQRQEQRPVARMIPEQIITGEILQLPALELEQRIMLEFERNPALTLEEVDLCPQCGAATSAYLCSACGHRPDPDDDVPVVTVDDWETYRERVHEAETLEPFATVCARRTLRDDLRAQWLADAPECDVALGLYLIECLDDDGYMREPLLEIATRFLRSVPQVEAVVQRVQALDPAGVGARDLRECLLLQCRYGVFDDGPPPHALELLNSAWAFVEARKLDDAAHALGVGREEVTAAMAWIGDHLAPYPGRARRDAWSHLAPREEPEVRPDVFIRRDGDSFRVEIVETSRFRVGLDPLYRRLDERMRRASAGEDADHVRRAVAGARWLADAIAQRRRTLHRVMTAVADAQAEYLSHGRTHLRPLMQKTIATRTGLHESTVCRALADKLVRLPSGETVSSAAFFDASAPVKEVLVDLIAREDPARPLSDARLAVLLEASGHKIARRTVAKYRESLRIPPLELRHR